MFTQNNLHSHIRCFGQLLPKDNFWGHVRQGALSAGELRVLGIHLDTEAKVSDLDME